MGDQAMQKVDVGGYANDAIGRQCLREALQGKPAVFTPDNQFRDHRIIKATDLVILNNTCIDPYVG